MNENENNIEVNEENSGDAKHSTSNIVEEQNNSTEPVASNNAGEQNNSAEQIVNNIDNTEPIPSVNNFTPSYTEQPNNIEQGLKKYKDIFNREEKNKTYQWDYEKYSKMDQFAKDKSSKNKGVIVFASIICSIIAVCFITFLSTSFFSWLNTIVLSNKEAADQQQNYATLEITTPENNNNKNSSMHAIPTISNSPATQIAKKVIPSVVSVVPYARVQSFYQTGITEIGSASGIIMSNDGYIITNSHVVLKLPTTELVDAVKVILNDKKEYEAKIIGVDVNTDLAILKINANNLIAAEFGDSNLLEVGENVYAIGSPVNLEYSGSMTAGIISALNRTVDNTSTIGYDNKYIQTDAAINPGNSGGALVNEKGQVVGINSSKLSATQIEGMGFSIPITQSKPVLDDLIKYGHVKNRVKLGITINREIDDILARLNNMQTGLLIESVEANHDLVSKGIMKYDILHEFDGVKIETVQELKEQLKKHKPGDIVHIVFYRYDQFNNNEQKIEVDVKLIEDEGVVKK